MSRFLIGTQNSELEDSIFIVEDNKVISSLKNLSKPSYIISENNSNILDVMDVKVLIYAIVKEVSNFENIGGGVATITLDKNNNLEIENIAFTKALGPTHLLYSSDNNILITANYSDSSVTLFSIDDSGAVNKELDYQKHVGHSVNLERQEAPHPHFVGYSSETNLFYIADLGLDKLFAYKYDKVKAELNHLEEKDILIPLGKGPRHYVSDPVNKNILYVLCELSSEIVVVDVNNPKAEPLQIISMLPKSFAADNIAAAIRLSPDGKFIYASNRGYDSVAIFAIENNRLSLVDIYNLGEKHKHPRDINITDDEVIVANLQSDTVQILARDSDSGKILSEIAVLSISKPSCIEIL